MLELGWLERDEGKATVYSLTDRGRQAVEKLGVDIYAGR